MSFEFVGRIVLNGNFPLEGLTEEEARASFKTLCVKLETYGANDISDEGEIVDADEEAAYESLERMQAEELGDIEEDEEEFEASSIDEAIAARSLEKACEEAEFDQNDMCYYVNEYEACFKDKLAGCGSAESGDNFKLEVRDSERHLVMAKMAFDDAWCGKPPQFIRTMSGFEKRTQ